MYYVRSNKAFLLLLCLMLATRQKYTESVTTQEKTTAASHDQYRILSQGSKWASSARPPSRRLNVIFILRAQTFSAKSVIPDSSSRDLIFLAGPFLWGTWYECVICTTVNPALPMPMPCGRPYQRVVTTYT